MNRRTRGGAICAVLFLTGYAAAATASERVAPTVNLPACDSDNGGLVLPNGVCAVVVADSIGRPRHIDVTADGDIYVHTRSARGRDDDQPGGAIVALRDADGDGRAEIVERFSDYYGTGLQLRGSHLYVSTATEVYRYSLTPGQLVPHGEPELVVSGFPLQRGHADKAFAFDEDCNLYVNVGAPSNTCMKQARTAGSVGQQPCPQLERQASVWRFDADRPGQTQALDGYQLVRGTRNIVGIAWDPGSRALYGVQHGRDALATLFGAYFNDQESAELPSEELLRLEDGANFGWPYCYYDRFQGKRVLAPEYDGNGREVGDCASTVGHSSHFPGTGHQTTCSFIQAISFPIVTATERSWCFTVHGIALHWSRPDTRWRSRQGPTASSPASGKRSRTGSPTRRRS